MEKPMRLYGGPADGHAVCGATYTARWLQVPVLGFDGIGAAVYERSGDVYLYVDADEYRAALRSYLPPE